MKKNIFTLVAVLGLFGVASVCGMELKQTHSVGKTAQKKKKKQPHKQPTITVTIKTLTDHSAQIPLPNTATIESLANQYYEDVAKYFTPQPERVRLVFAGNELTNKDNIAKKLDDFNIRDKSQIHAIMVFPKQEPQQGFIHKHPYLTGTAITGVALATIGAISYGLYKTLPYIERRRINNVLDEYGLKLDQLTNVQKDAAIAAYRAGKYLPTYMSKLKTIVAAGALASATVSEQTMFEILASLYYGKIATDEDVALLQEIVTPVAVEADMELVE